MTEQEALDLIKQLLKAKDEDELMQLVSLNLSSLDGRFFSTADAAVRQLELDGKPSAAQRAPRTHRPHVADEDADLI